MKSQFSSSLSLTSLNQAVQFIEKVEQDYPAATAYEIANRLRGHTKKAYTTKFWTLATGFQQKFVAPDLDGTVSLAEESTDFGHFIAALSDQLNEPGIKLSDMTQWTADYTSWAGDIGSSIVTYTRQADDFSSVMEAFDRFASDSDHVANIAAYIVGYWLNQDPQLKISQAIRNFHAEDFSIHVISFITLRFGDTDPAPQVRQQIVRYLSLVSDSGLWGVMRGWMQGRWFGWRQKQYTETEINHGIAHFLNFLQRKSQAIV
ncbi:hypothetical protein IQ266_16565 [filamentous cyanobacterium LEGE 11480]|uniref:Uncharacterized protein n=1 Tax=Romeriopsis navalis LEGE 11480 TaxID=2777977 RepID=A0A928VN32_9CYAN|nr:hypothetical protein [Romeriopsis navalis]MBE9031350.1 hypothetical protein [Romeriopsis navalis LEGE 11480]